MPKKKRRYRAYAARRKAKKETAQTAETTITDKTAKTATADKTEKNVETAEAANREFFERHGKDDDRDTEYSSQREESRARRKNAKRRGGHRTGDGFIRREPEFERKNDFREKNGTGTGTKKALNTERDNQFCDKPNNGSIARLERKAEKAARKTQKARERLPQKKEYRLVRHFDEATGKTTYELETRRTPKRARRTNTAAKASRMALTQAGTAAHRKISENEKDNSGVEAAHRTEQAAEGAMGKASRLKHDREAYLGKRTARLEKKQFRAETKFRYRKHFEENPQAKSRTLRKRLQKQRIKREYAKAAQKGIQTRQAAGYAQKATQATTAIARKIQEFARRNISAIATIGLLGMFFMVTAAGISSCSAMVSGGMSGIMAGSYQSTPSQLDASDEAMTSKEMALQNTIDSIEKDYPDYDEYNYNLDEIGHNPFTLINYLSAVYVNVDASAAATDIASLFDEMYNLTITPREETRTRTVTKTKTVTDPDTGEESEVEYEEEEEYTVKILDVELKSNPLETIVEGKLAGNDDAGTLYAIYQETNGALQQFYTPLDMDWYSMVSSYYGYRKNPITGENQYHRGVDIAVGEGTDVYAAHDGTVTTAEYNDSYGNYVVITDTEGYVTKYAHMESLNVSAGQTVRHGEVIGKTGNTGASTGSHLHIECLYNGEYYNPLFYFENGNGSIYGTTDAMGYGSGDAAALIAEAEKYLGYPYVWGGSSPSTSFDCSGFVCYVLKNSGYYDISRTTAQGIYNQSEHISASEARAGDIIFFTGTYASGNPVTHVGIYTGDGMMIHCGDPIKYSSINTPYWQSHFYAFGRFTPSD